MIIDDKALERWKQTFAKDGIVYEADDEYREAISNLVGYFELLIELERQQRENGLVEDEASRP